jgi:phage regulator Rha-like protein
MDRNFTTFLAVEAFIQEHSREIRGEKVLIDLDVACLYEISLVELYKIIGKNKRRFPPDFMFMLNNEEKEKLSLKSKKVFAFTQMGILMLGGQLKSYKAVRMHLQLINFFVDNMPGSVFEMLSNLQNTSDDDVY